MRRIGLLAFAIVVVLGGVWFVRSRDSAPTGDVAKPSAAPASAPTRADTRTALAAPPKESSAVAPIAKAPTASVVEAPKSNAPKTVDPMVAMLSHYKKDGKELLEKFRANPTQQNAGDLAALIVQANLDLDGKSIPHVSGEPVTLPPTDNDHHSMLSGFADETGDHSHLYSFSRADFPIYFDVEEFKNAPIGTFDAEKQKQLVGNLTDQAEKTLARLDQH